MAKDFFHQNAKEALIKDGWIITHDPYILKHRGLRMEVDLGAEKVFAAQRNSERILVEVKSFLSKSVIHDFHEALGQYLIVFSPLTNTVVKWINQQNIGK